MSTATMAPPFTLNVTEAAAAEIKKFMSSEEGLPDTAGLRVRVVPGGCSGFQYSLNIEEESRDGDQIIDAHGVRMFVDMFSAQYLSDVEINYVSGVSGIGLHVQQSERDGRLRLRFIFHSVNLSKNNLERAETQARAYSWLYKHNALYARACFWASTPEGFPKQ